MPSESPHRRAVLAAFGGAWKAYQEAASAAADEVEAQLLALRAPAASPAAAVAVELGPLGASHFDLDKIASLMTHEEAPSPLSIEALETAGRTLRDLATADPEATVQVGPGERVHGAVAAALARIGRGFGAAHVTSLARTARYEPELHAGWLRAYPFARWTRRERQLAPPILVEVDGADLHVSGLAEFLDGSVKIVLLVRDGAVPPAPLVRLMTPGVFVAQSHDGSELERFAAWSGPGVFAWMPSAAARFVHDPGGGPWLANRLSLGSEPAMPRRGLGAWSAAQLAEELRQLQALAAAPPPAQAGFDAPGGADPVDRLAAWLISRADLSEVAGAA